MTHDRDGGAAEFIAVPKEPTEAMWYWDDAPIDVDDAMSLASAFKAKLEENGLTIVAISAPKAQP